MSHAWFIILQKMTLRLVMNVPKLTQSVHYLHSVSLVRMRIVYYMPVHGAFVCLYLVDQLFE